MTVLAVDHYRQRRMALEAFLRAPCPDEEIAAFTGPLRRRTCGRQCGHQMLYEYPAVKISGQSLYGGVYPLPTRHQTMKGNSVEKN